jgi:hypothetical protein
MPLVVEEEDQEAKAHLKDKVNQVDLEVVQDKLHYQQEQVMQDLIHHQKEIQVEQVLQLLELEEEVDTQLQDKMHQGLLKEVMEEPEQILVLIFHHQYQTVEFMQGVELEELEMFLVQQERLQLEEQEEVVIHQQDQLHQEVEQLIQVVEVEDKLTQHLVQQEEQAVQESLS